MPILNNEDITAATKRLSTVFTNFPIHIFAIDTQGEIQFWNSKCETLFGYSTKDVLQTPNFLSVIIPSPNVKKRALKVFTSQKSLVRNFETHVKNKTGERYRIAWDEIDLYTLSHPGLRWFAGTNITETYENWKLVKKNHKKIDEIQQLAHIGSWDWDVASNEVTWSPEMFQIFGLTDSVDGYTTREIFRYSLLPSEFKHFKENVRKALNNPKLIAFEFKIMNPNKGIRIISARGDIARTNNKIMRVYGTIFDTTEIREAETKLKKIQKGLEKAQQIAQIGSWEHSFIDGKNYYSEEFAKIFNPSKSTEIYAIVTASINNKDKTKFKRFYSDAFLEKQNASCEFRINGADGEQKIISASAEIEHNGAGIPISVTGIFQDITEIKMAIEAEKTSELKIRNILHASPNAILVSDMEGNIIESNKATLELFGFETQSLKVLKNAQLFTEASYVQFSTDIDALVADEKQLKNVDYQMKHNTGFMFPAEVSVGLMKNKYNSPEYIVIIVKDITERVQYERQLRKAIKEAKSADRLKSAFLANMSHEIRTPMNAIIGFSNILSDPDLLPEERTEYINYITSSSVSLMTLIDDIIDISKIESGEINIKKAVTDVSEVLNDVYASINEQKIALNKAHLPVIENLPLKDYQIETDPVRLKQVLINLLNNAIKFTDNGAVEFGCEQKESNYKPVLEFYVKDSGIGIEKKHLEKIFTRFTKISNANAETLHRGTGLGLAISRKLIELMGGVVWAESEYGEGSTFRFTIPITQRTYQNQLRTETPESNLPKNYNWGNKIILIAEDEYTNFKYLNAVLKKAKPTILWAKDGTEAVEYCKATADIDLILMDIQMPVMDGYEATAIIKEMQPELPIIAQTAFAMAGQKERILSSGCDNYISKPINRVKLLALIDKYINLVAENEQD